MRRRARFQLPDRDPNRPTVPYVAELVRLFYSRNGNEAGGLLHVVLDDGNLGNGHIEYARDQAERAPDYSAWHIATCLLAMTPTQRRKVARSKVARSTP